MKFGYVALVGRPNVGKSTLLNDFLNKKLSITSKKPQTTRHRIMGIKTLDDVQMVFVDTPGLHLGEQKALNRYMNRAASQVLSQVDLILFIVSGTLWTEEDAFVFQKIKNAKVPVMLVINKIDLVRPRENLLPFIKLRESEHAYQSIIPISALHGEQVGELEACIIQNLPLGSHGYDPDQWTDRSDRFVASEFLREKLTRFLGQELPYDIAVTIEAFEETKNVVKIAALIWVEKDGQKAIVIGDEGQMLKKMSMRARLDMEAYFEKKVFLKTWVKVKNRWSHDEHILNQLGYSDD